MSALALIEQARASGVELRLVAGKVHASGTQDDLTRLIEPLRQHKADLLRWLTERANDDQVHSADAAPDPDRHCWPYSSAMTGFEIDVFTARLARFTDKGLALNDAEAMADRATQRDREAGDWYACLECFHLAGGATGSWRCCNWRRAGVALRACDAELPSDLVMRLQRCDGFKPHFRSGSVVVIEPGNLP